MSDTSPPKFKRDSVSPEMRARLMANRDGRLLPAQWIDLATEPLIILLILLPMALVIFGPRLVALLRAGWLVWLVAAVLLLVPVLLRAVRYARAPVYYMELRAGQNQLRRWVPWRALVFEAPTGAEVRFSKRLAPPLPLEPEIEYGVYYLDDPAGKVLLSAAPASHEHAELWRPTRAFRVRHARRTGKPLDEG